MKGLHTGVWYGRIGRAAVDYYAVDVHKKHSVYVCGSESGEGARRGRVANARDELTQMVAPSAGKA